ncbi:PspC domain-containing protein [Saccharopolyspora thermophila]|nr:PspC domain-containing protein [Saccharopolyspora subtropica]
MSENTTTRVRTLRRSRDDAMIAGICSGAARMVGVDPVIVRVLMLTATLLGFGTGILLYLACWLIVPEE